MTVLPCFRSLRKLFVRIPSIRPSLTSLGSRLRALAAPYSVLAFGSASIPSFDAFDSSFLGYFVRVSFRSRISNEWISGMVPHPHFLPSC